MMSPWFPAQCGSFRRLGRQLTWVGFLVAVWLTPDGARGEPLHESHSRTWRFAPHGRTWLEYYTPSDREVFLDLGNDLGARLFGPSRWEFFFHVRQRTQAGYYRSPRPDAPPTPVDLNHQLWQQSLGVKYCARIPLFAFFLRDCNHFLDRGDVQPIAWTTFVLGAGTLPPAGDFKPDPPCKSSSLRWFAGGGPTVRTKSRNIWSINSPVSAEAWTRARYTRTLTRFVSADLLSELGLQKCSAKLHTRHHATTEAAIMLHSGGGWRLYLGRRWRDTRFLWPADQRMYCGISFVY